MLVKITSEMLAAVGGAKDSAEFTDKLSAFIAKAKENETFMAENQVTLESLQKSITDMEAKILTEDKVKTIVGAETAAAMKVWAGSDEGKKIIGAEASRITVEALANVGTTPAKPAPASAGGETPEQKVKDLLAQGKFEEAWALDKSLQSEFVTAKSYAAYMRNAASVRITIK